MSKHTILLKCYLITSMYRIKESNHVARNLPQTVFTAFHQNDRFILADQFTESSPGGAPRSVAQG